MRRVLKATGVLILVSIAATACDEKLSSLTGPTPSLEPTFKSIQDEIFENADSSGRAACVQCHTTVGRPTPAGGLDLTHAVAYTNLVGVASRERPAMLRVAAGDPDNSYLIHKLEGAPDIVGRRMPFNGPPYLTDGQILVIRRWIALGAPNN